MDALRFWSGYICGFFSFLVMMLVAITSKGGGMKPPK